MASTVAHAAKGGDGENEEDVDAAAALPHAVAPVGAPSAYCCGGERSVYSCGGAEESKGGGGRRKKTATRLLHCRTQPRPWERLACIRVAAGMRRRRVCYIFANFGARGSAKRGGGEALRRVATL
jgi:hypothetical protein